MDISEYVGFFGVPRAGRTRFPAGEGGLYVVHEIRGSHGWFAASILTFLLGIWFVVALGGFQLVTEQY